MICLDLKKQLHGINGDFNLNFKIEINEGDFVSLSGKSGSGKTTILRILAGLESSNSAIKVNNEIWQNDKIFKKVQKRDIGFVFQDYALFPNMSVEQNLLYVNNDKNLANKLLEMTHILGLKDLYPNNLSGGQQQRVALCRAFMKKPKILLLDEPLSALDKSTREQIQDEIIKLHKEFKTTTILVSHDQDEIDKLCNKQIFIDNGTIIKEKIVKKKFELKTPFLSADGIIKLYDKKENFQGIVLISRLNEPFGIALPGGFVDIGETVEMALIREMKEEVNLEVKIQSLQGIYSNPKRDPRFHTATVVYVCKAYGTPKSGDDAKEVFVYKIEDIPFDKLVFDHKDIIKEFIKNKSANTLQ